MPIDRSNTDFRHLEDKVNEALTWQELDRALHPIASDILKVGAALESQGVALGQISVRLGQLEERASAMAAYSDKVTDRLREFAKELDDADARLGELTNEREKFKWLARVLWALAAGAVAIAFKVVDLWPPHK